uniref:Uncharacterized protein n=1 Tax=Triticum urartu TaxID=4572 RepID=A0A8R7PF58_TRIUA
IIDFQYLRSIGGTPRLTYILCLFADAASLKVLKCYLTYKG